MLPSALMETVPFALAMLILGARKTAEQRIVNRTKDYADLSMQSTDRSKSNRPMCFVQRLRRNPDRMHSLPIYEKPSFSSSFSCQNRQAFVSIDPNPQILIELVSLSRLAFVIALRLQAKILREAVCRISIMDDKTLRSRLTGAFGAAGGTLVLSPILGLILFRQEWSPWLFWAFETAGCLFIILALLIHGHDL